MFDLSDLKKLSSQARNAAGSIEKDDLLRYLGVEERRSGSDVFFTSLGIFTAGVLVGAGAALLLAPKTGAEFRSDLKTRIQSGVDQGASQLSGNGAQTGSTRSSV